MATREHQDEAAAGAGQRRRSRGRPVERKSDDGQDPQLGENHRQWKTGKAMTIEEAIENLDLALA